MSKPLDEQGVVEQISVANHVSLAATFFPQAAASVNFSSTFSNHHLSIAAVAYLRNRKELASDLCLSESDVFDLGHAQLIALAYAQWGKECVKHLRGDFAFVLWDQQNNELVCARDAMGTLPLYYRKESDTIYIATEIRAIGRALGRDITFNHQRLANMVATDANHDQSLTFYDGIYSFLPGHIATITKGRIHLDEYWQPDIHARLSYVTVEETLEAFRHLFFENIASYCQPSTKIGVLLSGGLDSSGIVSALQHLSCTNHLPIETFSTVPSNTTLPQSSDDSHYLHEFAQNSKIRLNWVDAGNTGPFSDVEAMIAANETPLYTDKHYRYRAFGEAANEKGIQLLLDGVGGELGATAPVNPFLLNTLLSGRWSQLYREFKARQGLTESSAMGIMAQYFVRPLITPLFQTHNIWRELLQPDFVHLFHSDENAFRAPFNAFSGAFSVRRHQYQWIKKAQKTSCRFGALGEMTHIRRVFPYRDTRILDFCLAADMSAKMRHGYPRYMLRGSMHGVMPEKNRWRMTKAPFSPDHVRRFSRQRHEALLFFQQISARDPVRSVVKIDNLIQLCLKKDDVSFRTLYIISQGMFLIVFLRQFSEYRMSC